MQSVVETIIEASEKIQTQESTISSLNNQIDTDNGNFDDIYDAIVDKGQQPTKADRTTYAPAIEAIVTGGAVLDTLNVTPTTSAQQITPPSGTDGYDEVNVAAVDNTIDANIVAGNIKDGVTILGVTGNYSGGSGTYQSKSVTPSANQQVVTADQGYDALSQVTVDGDADLVASNIKSGVSIFGVQGSYNPSPTLQTKNVTPTTSAQQITADSGYDGLQEVDVAAVTSSIDSNIIAGNIKKDVVILGVTGTFEGSGSGSEIYTNIENAGTEPSNAFESTVVQYKDKLCVVGRSAVWEYDVDTKTFTQLFTGSNILKNDYRAAYKSVMVGNRIYYFDGTTIYYFDFDTQTRSTLVNGSGTLGSNLASITSDGTNLYLADGSTSTIWKIDISTATITALATSVTRIPTQMVYRRGYIYGTLGEYIDKVDVSDGTITPVLNTGTSTAIDFYRCLVADSDYIYGIGGDGTGKSNAVIKIASDDTYETITTDKNVRQAMACIYHGDLYLVNENQYWRDRQFSKYGEGLNKDFIVGGTDVGDIDTSNIKRITVI